MPDQGTFARVPRFDPSGATGRDTVRQTRSFPSEGVRSGSGSCVGLRTDDGIRPPLDGQTPSSVGGC